MDERDEQGELLKSVQEWFDDPEQVRHYRHEASSGPTSAEEWLLSALPPSGRVLDLGCGAGRITLALARRGYDAVGVDVSQQLVDAATALAAEQGVSARFLRTAALHLPFDDGSFDATIAFKVYGYIPSRAARGAYLDEIYRVLRPGAPLLLTYYSVPSEEEARAVYEHDEQYRQTAARFTSLEPCDTFSAGKGYVHWFTAEALQEEFAQSRFHVEAFRGDEAFGGQGFIQLAILRR